MQYVVKEEYSTSPPPFAQSAKNQSQKISPVEDICIILELERDQVAKYWNYV